jgi:hypothetical protein
VNELEILEGRAIVAQGAQCPGHCAKGHGAVC